MIYRTNNPIIVALLVIVNPKLQLLSTRKVIERSEILLQLFLDEQVMTVFHGESFFRYQARNKKQLIIECNEHAVLKSLFYKDLQQ